MHNHFYFAVDIFTTAQLSIRIVFKTFVNIHSVVVCSGVTLMPWHIVEIGRQLAIVSSVLPCESQGSNSGYQVPLPAVSPPQISTLFLECPLFTLSRYVCCEMERLVLLTNSPVMLTTE